MCCLFGWHLGIAPHIKPLLRDSGAPNMHAHRNGVATSLMRAHASLWCALGLGHKRAYIAQIRGAAADSCQCAWRQARRMARSNCTEGSTWSDKTRTSTVCGFGLVAPALAESR